MGSSEEMLRAPKRAGNFQLRLSRGGGNTQDASLADFENTVSSALSFLGQHNAFHLSSNILETEVIN